MSRSPITFCRLFAAFACAAFAACSGMSTQPSPVAAPALPEQRVGEIVGSADRSAADRINDLRRKPEQMLAFIGIRPGMVALNVSAAGGSVAISRS